MTSAPPDGRAVLSARLESFLNELRAGRTPNSGRFCASCYNPLPPAFERCDHCGQGLDERPALASVPLAVLDIHLRKQRRESLVVNAFAYLGLGLGLGLFLLMVAINVLYLAKAFWFFILAVVALVAGSRLLAALFGGVIGDELGYRYAKRRMAEEWARHVAEREESKLEPP